MMKILSKISQLFNKLYDRWKSPSNMKFKGLIIVGSFIISLILIELKQFGLLTPELSSYLPENHFYAINIGFSLLLYMEVIDLVFGLGKSFSKAVGKQFQIFSLILLRQSFKDLQYISWPLTWDKIPNAFKYIFADAGTALLIFGILALFYSLLLHQPITDNEDETYSFIYTKKAIALSLLIIMNLSGVFLVAHSFLTGTEHNVFEFYYTILVFSDILIVLISLIYSTSYPVVFRNSGFALSTVLLRISLTAPVYTRSVIGTFSALFVVSLVFIYNKYIPIREQELLRRKQITH